METVNYSINQQRDNEVSVYLQFYTFEMHVVYFKLMFFFFIEEAHVKYLAKLDT